MSNIPSSKSPQMLTGAGSLGRSTLLPNVTVDIPMPSGAKPPATPTANQPGGQKSAE